MQLDELLQSSGILATVGGSANLSLPIAAVVADSRKAVPGCLFIAVSGGRFRGLDFVQGAIERGAVAVVVDEPLHRSDITVLQVESARAAAGPLASAWWGHPSRTLQIVGVTGTNGKTTTAVLIAQLCTFAGLRAAAIGTLGIWTAEGVLKGSLTTPDPLDLQEMLANLRDQRYRCVAMEVSSHALDQHRVAGVQFAATLWTNLTQDHLDYHGTTTAYAAAKALLFSSFKAPAAFVNGDDDFARMVWQNGLAQAWSLGSDPAAEHQVKDLVSNANGLTLTLHSQGRAPLPLRSPLLGRHNAENLTAAVLACRAIGIDDKQLQHGAAKLSAPRGRLEPVANQLGALVLVDYAHTPDALQKALITVRSLVAPRGRLLVVFGCGGDRDRGKRPLMAKIAAELADLSLLTSDNPRSELPQAIVAEMEVGCVEAGITRLDKLVPSTLSALGTRPAYVLETDRCSAIRRAIGVLRQGDVLLIAGKGHEVTQTIGEAILPFDDVAVAMHWLATLKPLIIGDKVTVAPQGYAFTAAQLAQATAGRILVDSSRVSRALATDSRKIEADALFFALPGERFDGHAFLAEVLRAGAAGVVVEAGKAEQALVIARECNAYVVEVADTLLALGAVSRVFRQRFSPLTVGITGSNGKTTTKELTALALSPLGQVLATQGNFNNRIGVPLTLARLQPQHRAAVVEMGMSEPGEIALLAAMAEPSIGVVTSIAEAHLQGLGSLAGIAAEKASLLKALPADGVAIVPADEPLLDEIVAQIACRVVRFGRQKGDVRLAGPVTVDGLQQRFTAQVFSQSVPVLLPGLGVHLAHNALAALAVAAVAGLDLLAAAEALSRYQPVGQRMLPSRIGPWLVLEDCYNANPRSTETALETLASLQGPHIAVLGSMLELGAQQAELHERVGAFAASVGIDLLVAVGEFAPDLARGARRGGLRRVVEVADALSAANEVIAFAPASATVLVKGSRGARMERVIADFKVQFPAPAASASALGATEGRS